MSDMLWIIIIASKNHVFCKFLIFPDHNPDSWNVKMSQIVHKVLKNQTPLRKQFRSRTTQAISCHFWEESGIDWVTVIVRFLTNNCILWHKFLGLMAMEHIVSVFRGRNTDFMWGGLRTKRCTCTHVTKWLPVQVLPIDPDYFPEWSPLNGGRSRTHLQRSQLSSIQKATMPANA